MKTNTISSALLAIVIILGLSQATFADPPGGKPPGGFTECDLMIKPSGGPHFEHRCRTELIEVQQVIMVAESITGRTYESLQSKVCSADDKLHVDKWSDAAQKLRDIASTVRSKKKVDMVEAETVATKAEEIATDIENFTCDLDLLP